MTTDELIRRLEINAYGVYSATLVGNPAPFIKGLRERVKNPRVGDLVLEITTFWTPAQDGNRLGRFLREDVDDVQGEIVYIETLDGREFRWHNATFITVAESPDFFNVETLAAPYREKEGANA